MARDERPESTADRPQILRPHFVNCTLSRARVIPRPIKGGMPCEVRIEHFGAQIDARFRQKAITGLQVKGDALVNARLWGIAHRDFIWDRNRRETVPKQA